MSLIHPATVIVSGGTGSGKTVLTRKLLQHHVTTFINMPHNPKVLWCYGIQQPIFKDAIVNINIRYHEGMIDEPVLVSIKPDVLVVDDMMCEKSKDAFMHNLFTKMSHHMGITVIFITQNLYEKGQCNMKRNAHYLFVMRNLSDKTQITTLGRQLFPRRKSMLDHFYDSYDDATKERYGYLLIDVSPHSDERFKLKTNIFPEDGHVVVYTPK